MADKFVKQFNTTSGTILISASRLEDALKTALTGSIAKDSTGWVKGEDVFKMIVTAITGSSDTTVPSEKAVKTYVATEIGKIGTPLTVEIVDNVSKVTKHNVLYLVGPKSDGEGNQFYDEYILPKDSTTPEKIGDTHVTVSVATTEKAGVVLSTATTAGAVSVDSTGKMTVNGWDTKVDTVEGKGLSTNDFDNDAKTKLAGITDEASKVTLSGKTITIKNGTTEQTIVVPEEPDKPTPAYSTIEVTNHDGETKKSEATSDNTTFGLKAGNGIELTPDQSAATKNPVVTISATDITPVATTALQGKAALPYYNSTSEEIDLTGEVHS